MKKGILIILSIVLVYLVVVSLAPIQTLKRLEAQTSNDSLFMTAHDPALNAPVMDSLVRMDAFLDAMLKQSVTDSIEMALNIADSSLVLTIKGVVIHKTKVQRMEVDKVFKKMSNLTYKRLFSKPLAIEHQFATIVKEPVVVREAPKTPEEAEVNAWEPDTLIQNPAFLQLRLEHGLQIIIEQDENPDFFHKRQRFAFLSKLWMQDKKASLLAFVTFKKQPYAPTIHMYLPVDELRSVYRALPQNATISMHF